MKLGALLRERLIDPLRRAQGSPPSIARGGAMGMWVALTPTVGAQMLIVTALAVPLRANLPVALAMVWISNPVTLVPLYFAFYLLGAVLLGQGHTGFSEFAALFEARFEAFKSGEVGLVDTMLGLGHEVFWPMVVGSVIIATLAAVPTYYLMFSVARRAQARRARDGSKRPHRPAPTSAAVAGESSPPPAVDEARKP